MNEVIKFLNEHPVQYLATVGQDGKAKCRPFMFAGELEGKLWFCTNSTKDVYKDMQANPYAVSYTHLDVYKRQAHRIRIIGIRKNQMVSNPPNKSV